ncbi:MAG: hypothetical protein N4A44_03130 [Alphaproteobacteria bacterium]|jgi:hypothetical protein|nr:hypothetical protein [Alphaproteobacteria bacterium]
MKVRKTLVSIIVLIFLSLSGLYSQRYTPIELKKVTHLKEIKNLYQYGDFDKKEEYKNLMCFTVKDFVLIFDRFEKKNPKTFYFFNSTNGELIFNSKENKINFIGSFIDEHKKIHLLFKDKKDKMFMYNGEDELTELSLPTHITNPKPVTIIDEEILWTDGRTFKVYKGKHAISGVRAKIKRSIYSLELGDLKENFYSALRGSEGFGFKEKKEYAEKLFSIKKSAEKYGIDF